MENHIKSYIEKSIKAKQTILQDDKFLSNIEQIVNVIVSAYKSKHKVLLAGNGGSAADAQHIAAEFVSKFMYDRVALNAIALTTNSSIITSVGNDYSHEYVFARQIQAYGTEGDIFIPISTSGNSKNIILAIEEAKKRNLITIGLTGNTKSQMEAICDFIIKIPSDITPIIQEAHIMIGHIICALVEKEFID